MTGSGVPLRSRRADRLLAAALVGALSAGLLTLTAQPAAAIGADANTPPAVPTDLVTWYGDPCVDSAPGRFLGGDDVRLAAAVTDPDVVPVGTVDPLAGVFAVWSLDDPSARVEHEDRADSGQVWIEYPAEMFTHGGCVRLGGARVGRPGGQ